MSYGRWMLGIAIIVAATLCAGILHGRMSNRWGPSTDTLAAARTLEQLPHEFGRWRERSTYDIGQAAREMLECAAQVGRVYENQDTGEIVSLTLILGPPGPTSVHTPEVCFASRDYQSLGQRRRSAVSAPGEEKNEIWISDYRANNLHGDMLRVCYAWTTGDQWSAPDDARFAFAGAPYLYKMQFSALLRPGLVSSQDTCERFLHDFVPAARRYLIKPSLR